MGLGWGFPNRVWEGEKEERSRDKMLSEERSSIIILIVAIKGNRVREMIDC